MEQLSGFMDMGLKKAESLELKMIDQIERGMNMETILKHIATEFEIKSWMEIGFFIACGFFLGIIVGTIATISIGCCIRQFFKVRPKQNPIEVAASPIVLNSPELVIDEIKCNLEK